MERARMAPGKKEAGTIGIRWTACPQEEDVVVETVTGGLPSDRTCEPIGASLTKDPLETGTVPHANGASVELLCGRNSEAAGGNRFIPTLKESILDGTIDVPEACIGGRCAGGGRGVQSPGDTNKPPLLASNAVLSTFIRIGSWRRCGSSGRGPAFSFAKSNALAAVLIAVTAEPATVRLRGKQVSLTVLPAPAFLKVVGTSDEHDAV